MSVSLKSFVAPHPLQRARVAGMCLLLSLKARMMCEMLLVDSGRCW
jgi:hypothetical protein